MKNPLIIFGSSRSNDGTMKAVQLATRGQQIPIVDLAHLSISYYDYSYRNQDDDFLPLAERMVLHDLLILATPVYWYTMSAIMKTFLDRWSDLLDIRKDLGRRLAGKHLAVITSYGVSMPEGFEDAFRQTCTYMDMTYKGCFYYYSGPQDKLQVDNHKNAQEFAQRIFTT